METAELEFPPIVEPAQAPAAPTAIATAIVTLKAAALAPFDAIEQPLRVLAQRYDKVAYDCATPAGFKAAKEARSDLRENGRYAVQRAADAFKKNANDAKKAVEAKAEALIAIVKPAEDSIHAQVQAEEDRRERQRQEAARIEEERKAGLNAAVMRIYGYIKAATGMPSERIAAGIAYVEKLTFGDDWQEYKGRAEEAKAEALLQMRQLHADAIEADRLRAENERLAAELATARAAQEAERQAREAEDKDIDRINDAANNCVTRGSQFIIDELCLFDNVVVPGLSKAGRVQALVPVARGRMLSLIEAAKEREAADRAAEVKSSIDAKCHASLTVTTSAGAVADAATGEILSSPNTQERACSPADAPCTNASNTPEAAGVPSGDEGPAALAIVSAAEPATEEPTMKLGDVCAKLGFSMTAAFVRDTLGVAPTKVERAANWYTQAKVQAIKSALLAHVEKVL